MYPNDSKAAQCGQALKDCSQVEAQFNRLEDAICYLNDRAQLLQGRISPVVRPCAPVTEQATKIQGIENLVPTANRIAQFRDRVQAIGDMIDSNIARLEL